MPAIISEKFRIFNAKQFIESFSEGADDSDTARTMSYFFVGRPQRWDVYLEYHSKTSTSVSVGDTVFVGPNSTFGNATWQGIVREVNPNSLMLHTIGPTVASTPAYNSILRKNDGSGTAIGKTGTYRYATDEVPPYPYDNQKEKYDLFDDIIAAKRIKTENVRTVVSRYNWASNTVYDMWKPDYSSNATGRIGKQTANSLDSLYGASKYYVMTDDYKVWMCLQNSDGAQSTEQPVNSGANYDVNTGLFTQTGGAYVWKHMYTIPTNDVLKFLSTEFIPIVIPTETSRAYVIANQVVDGAIDAYVIEDAGSGLTATQTYYAPVNGDGSGAIAKIVVNGSGNVSEASMQVRGSGYTYGTIEFAAGSGSGANKTGLYSNVGLTSSANPGGSASIEVVIPPQGGFGADMEMELNGKRVMTNVRIASTEGSGDFPVDNDFRRIGIVQNLYTNGSRSIADTLNGLTSLKIENAGADYFVDETVTQDLGNGLTAKATVVSWTPDSVGSYNGILRVFQSPEYHKDGGVVRSFDNSNGASAVVGSSAGGSGANGTIDDTYNQSAGTNLFGSFTNGISVAEIDNNKGDVIYIENRRLITRSADQIEDIKLVVEF